MSSSKSSKNLVITLSLSNLFIQFRFYFWNAEQIAVKSTIIDKETVHRVVSQLLEVEADVEDSSDPGTSTSSALRVVDAFDFPKYKYDTIRKQFYE